MEKEVKKYVCECGKEFDNPQAFNGHKSHCKIHQELKHGSLDYLEEVNKIRQKKQSTTLKTKNKQNKSKELQNWILEKHVCETCGKVMIEKYGSGRFCSKSCASSKLQSIKSKAKISNSINSSIKFKSAIKSRRDTYIKQYYLSPNLCKYCGKPLPYELRNRNTCSDECLKIALSTPNNSPRPQFMFGTYKGIKCDSSWELAFLVYNFDMGILIERNKQHFDYTHKGVKHHYYPDFIINNIYYEIKGRITDIDYSKFECFPKELKLVVITKTGIKSYIKYCKEKYGKNFCEILYDKNEPSYFNFDKKD